jgi:hypothetical protein
MKRLRRLQASIYRLLAGWEETENEIRHRLKDPDQYDTCRSKDVTSGVRLIVCKKKGSDTWEPQALRFDSKKFTLAEAKAWVKENWEKQSQQSVDAREILSLSICEPVRFSGESLDEQTSNVRNAFYDQFQKQPAPANSIYVREVFDDYVIADGGSEGMFKIGYRTTDSKTEFDPRDKWTKVEVQYVKAAADLKLMMASNFRAQSNRESQPKGTSWDVTIIKTGKTQTDPPIWITAEALEASKSIFNGAKVYAVLEGDRNGHKSDPNKKVIREVVGVLENPYVDGNELKATLHILPSEQWLRDNLLFLESKNKLHVYQLSVDSIIATEKKNVPELGQEMLVMKKMVRADLDIVSEAAAGGKFNKLVASKQQSQSGDSTMLKHKLLTLFLLVYPTFLASKNIDVVKIDENELFTHLLAADKPQSRLHLPDGAQLDEKVIDEKLTAFRAAIDKDQKAADPPNQDLNKDKNKQDDKTLQAALDPIQKEMKELRLQACAGILATKLAESKLPQHLQTSIQKRWENKLFTAKDLDEDIKSIRDMFAPFTQPGVNNRGMDIQAGVDEQDKFQAALDGFFLTAAQCLKPVKKGTEEYKTLLAGVDPFRSIKEAYVQFTGDVNVTGQLPKNPRFLASLATTDWANVLAATLNRRLVRDYGALMLDTWRAFVDIVPLNNFKQQERVRFGGYANLAIVAERGPYNPLVSPTDEKAYYSPAKRGGTEDITREMIFNDDVGSIQKIPTRMARAAGQTLHEFVYDFIRPGVNPVIYDGAVLYVAGHSNTATAALAADGVAFGAARLRMKKQAMGNNSKRLGLRAGLLVVPPELEAIAYGLVTPAFNKSNTVPEFLQQLGIIPVLVDYWTDPTDWVLIARREDISGLEIGFINGQETPEIFVADMPTIGSAFTNDVNTFKIRHEYGGAIIDYRAFDGSIVA